MATKVRLTDTEKFNLIEKADREGRGGLDAEHPAELRVRDHR